MSQNDLTVLSLHSKPSLPSVVPILVKCSHYPFTMGVNSSTFLLHSTSNTSSILFSYNSETSLKSNHFSHSLLPFSYPKLLYHLSLNNSIKTHLCTPISSLVCLTTTYSPHSSQIFENKSDHVTFWLKIHQRLPIAPKRKSKLLLMNKRPCMIWAH